MEIVREKEKGFLSYEEWSYIIYYIYDKDDAQFLESKILDFVRKRLESVSKSQQYNNKRLTREEEANLLRVKEDMKILFKEFSKIVMDYQIKLRDRYLNNFVFIFKKIDQDNNGIINEEEFYRLIAGIGYYGADTDIQTERLLHISDPYNNKQLTFSECINLFALEIIVDQDEKGNEINTSLLDKIASDENVVLNFN